MLVLLICVIVQLLISTLGSLEFPSTHKFTILQLTDLHFAEGRDKDESNTKLMSYLIE
jgi:predicted MPP superfamily phosphohydrolase